MVEHRPGQAMLRVAFLLLALALSILAPASAEAGEVGRHFNRGINISRWFWFGQRNPAYWANYIDQQQLNGLRAMGFDHVRIPMDVDFMFNRRDPDQLRNTAPVAAAIRRARSAGLAVILDPLHNAGTDFENANLDQDGFVERKLAVFMEAFARWASSVKDADGRAIPPAMLAIELMNEPVFDGDGQRWLDFVQPRLLAAARRGAPRNPIIVSGAGWAGLDGLLRMKPYADRNVLYKLHYYRPYTFTHQGADWDTKAVKDIQPIPFPAYPSPFVEEIDTAIGATPNAESRTMMATYRNQRWTAESIRADLAAVKAWQNRHGVEVIVNEFGVYQLQTSPAAQGAWIAAVVDACRRNGWGWTLWEWKDYKGFGLYQEDWSGNLHLQTQVFDALGLRSLSASR